LKRRVSTAVLKSSFLPPRRDFLGGDQRVAVSLGHSDHVHTYHLRFTKDHGSPVSAPVVVEEPDGEGIEYQDVHDRAQAEDIAWRFSNRAVTTPQIVLFCITGGLMPCPAAFTILLVCLQIKKAVPGFAWSRF